MVGNKGMTCDQFSGASERYQVSTRKKLQFIRRPPPPNGGNLHTFCFLKYSLRLARRRRDSCIPASPVGLLPQKMLAPQWGRLAPGNAKTSTASTFRAKAKGTTLGHFLGSGNRNMKPANTITFPFLWKYFPVSRFTGFTPKTPCSFGFAGPHDCLAEQ